MADKSQDEMLREAAKARGFKLVKSRRRKAGGDFGKYGLVDAKNGRECFGFGGKGLTGTAETVLGYLRGGEAALWKRSLMGVVAGRKAAEKEPAASPDRGDKAPSSRKRKGDSKRPSTSLERSGKANARRKPSPPPGPVEPAEPVYRLAKPDDAKALAQLIGAKPKQLNQQLAAAKKAGTNPIIAERDRIVGVVAWTIIPLLTGLPRGRVTLLHVAEDARREGIGTCLLAKAERAIGKAGAERVELLIGIDFDAPAGFLRKTGWQRSANGYGKAVG